MSQYTDELDRESQAYPKTVIEVDDTLDRLENQILTEYQQQNLGLKSKKID